MFQAALVTILTTAQLGPPTKPAPPDVAEVKELTPAELAKLPPAEIMGLENAVITARSVKFESIKTADGPRIRLMFGDTTLVATKVQVRTQYPVDGKPQNRIISLWIDKEGKTLMESNLEPAPKPKQP